MPDIPHRDTRLLGSSVIPMIVCEPLEHPYGKSVHDAYALLSGLVGWGEKSEIAKYALEREDEYRRMYERLYDVQLDAGRTFTHPAHKRLVATPDGFNTYRDDVVEIKHLTAWKLSQWSVKTQEIPYAVRVQNLWQTGIYNASNEAKPCECGHVYASVGGFPPTRYDNPFTQEAFDALLTCALDFLSEHVDKETPPPPDYSTGCKEYIASYFPAAFGEGKNFIESEEIAALLALRRTLADSAKGIKSEIDYCDSRLKFLIGSDNYGAFDPETGNRFTWYNMGGNVSPTKVIAELQERAGISDDELEELKDEYRGKEYRKQKFTAGKLQTENYQ